MSEDELVSIYSEMIGPQTGQYFSILPQGLTHLAALKAAGNWWLPS